MNSDLRPGFLFRDTEYILAIGSQDPAWDLVFKIICSEKLLIKRKLPIGIQDFTEIVTGDYVYIDKTALLYRLITEGKPYFFSRPRRFGKSLTISTLEAIFLGKRELFKGLWIATSSWDWRKYAVVRLDMSTINRQNPDILRRSLIARLSEIGAEQQLVLSGETPADYLRSLVVQLAKTAPVVVLVDEYDKPILDNIHDVEIASAMRDELKDLYTVLKAEDSSLKFIFLTGVTKFSKVSIFSGLNNLHDLTMLDNFSSLVGYTEEELKFYFDDAITDLAKHAKIDVMECYKKLKQWYNGYQFSPYGQQVYNPFSVLNALHNKQFASYWFETGTPTFLLDLIKQREFDLKSLEKIRVGGLAFKSFELNEIPTLPLLYQTGYMTIKSYDPHAEAFTLSYPNQEVHQAFTESLFSYFATKKAEISEHLIELYYNLAAKTWDSAEFLQIINNILALIPYDLYIKQEKYFQSLFYLAIRFTGIKLNAEFKTQLGRADACLELQDKIIIFELKLNKTAKEGLQQIHQQKYYEIFNDQKRPIYLVAINFNGQSRCIDDYLVEQL